MNPTYVIKNGCVVQGWAYATDLKNYFRGVPAYLVNQIYVVPRERGKGIGTELLTLLTTDADRARVMLVLDFQPAEFNSDATRLHLFYERFGFTWDEEIGGMRREPQ